MTMEISYLYVCDLVYHMLAHMPVNNASCLYSEEYIGRIREEKAGRFQDLAEPMGQLAEYYNAHFDRLAVVNFLPYYCQDVPALLYTLESYPSFTTEDREAFLRPFSELLQKEDGFYGAYWKGLYDKSEKARKCMEVVFTKEWEKYRVLGNYFQKDRAIAGISYSMTCNGRGLGLNEAFLAIVPFSEEERDYERSFLQLLHEYTHGFADAMLQQEISMEDGSHDFSENVVIMFDYYLIKALCPDDLQEYFRFISPNEEKDGSIMTEEILHSVFELPLQWHEKLKRLVGEICSIRK